MVYGAGPVSRIERINQVFEKLDAFLFIELSYEDFSWSFFHLI